MGNAAYALKFFVIKLVWKKNLFYMYLQVANNSVKVNSKTINNFGTLIEFVEILQILASLAADYK